MNYQPVLYHANLVENLCFVCWVLVSEFTQEYAENISRYSCGTLEKILGIVLRKFPGMGSEELFAGNSKKISTKVVDIFCSIGNKKFPGIGDMKFLG